MEKTPRIQYTEAELERIAEYKEQREERALRGNILLRKAKEKTVMKLYEEYIKTMLYENPAAEVMDFLEFITPELRDPIFKQIEQQRVRNEVEDKDWYFITINPDPKKDFNDFYRDFKSCLSLTPFKSHKWIYAIDQRSEGEDEASGFHIHLVYNRRVNTHTFCRPSEWKNTLKRKLEKYVGNEKHFKFVNINTDEDLLRCIDYVKGIKKESKMGKQIRTNKWLAENGFEQFYSNGDIAKIAKCEE